LYIGLHPQPIIETVKRDIGVVARIADQARTRAAQ
jgi:hypothetical protein